MVDNAIVNKALEDHWDGTGWMDSYPPEEWLQTLDAMRRIDDVLAENPLFAKHVDGLALVIKDSAVQAIIAQTEVE